MSGSLSTTTGSGTASRSRADRISAFSHSLSTTPGWLRTVSVAVVVVSLFVGLFASFSLTVKTSAVERIGNHTVPSIIDAQRIHAALLDADRNAANSYLQGGEGNDLAHTRYLANIKLATEALEQAAQHTAFGEEVSPSLLVAMNGLNRYTALVERARANSRLGYPVGQAYLTDASRLMHDEILPAIDQLNSINAAHLEDDYASASASSATLAVILGGGIAVLVILAYGQVFLSRRFKRRINELLILATITVVATVGSSALLIASADSHVVQAKQNHYTQLHRLWESRSLVNDANLNETLSLIARGSGTKFDAAFEDSRNNFNLQLQAATAAATTDSEKRSLADVRAAFEEFLSVDAQIRELVAGGRHDDAVKLTLGTDNGQLGQKFTQLDLALQTAINSKQQAFDSHIATAQSRLFGQNYWLPLAALIISLCTLAGLQQRIKEYAG